MAIDRPKWEVADIFRQFGEEYQRERLTPVSHQKVMNHIETCRTAALGGHLEECNSCGHQRPVYNSCRDRHCPKCQTLAKERWLEARKAELLPVNYFHKVFTIPHELNNLTLQNKRTVLNILFKSVSETLLQFGNDPRNKLGGKVGFTLVLHTWNQQLLDHFHLHCIIPAGALNEKGKSWIHSKGPLFLFSIKALSIVFREKFISYLQGAYDNNKLVLGGSLKDLEHPKAFECFVDQLKGKKWVVYSKAPFGGPEKVLEYLGRYTHKVAISNHRIIDITENNVTFSYRDRKDGNQVKSKIVSGIEFIRRFLLHVLPKRFMRIRHYGFLASRSKKVNLEKCREALDVIPPKITKIKKTVEEFMQAVVGLDIFQCPCCKSGRMNKVKSIHSSFDKTILTPVYMDSS